ncbi:hypothetical protein [Ectothiorhodospira sp. PHS-1]|uniref:hypothetical protein n=2 Tax=Ectothiorhodospira TaxID=1051 RepID=UPI00143A49FE|nr:hypothetical protein [Ectothiorhodospira sp. PHS-1]
MARVLKAVGERRSIDLKLSTHSMRKIRDWTMHNAGKPIELICMALNHSSPAVTMRYLGITQEEVHALADEFCLGYLGRVATGDRFTHGYPALLPHCFIKISTRKTWGYPSL